MPTPQIKLPRTATRRGLIEYAKLLRAVVPQPGSFDFDGVLHRPGTSIPYADLWPAPDYPTAPVLLECAGPQSPGWGHNRTPTLYVIWRYDAARETWAEMARSTAYGLEWVDDLAPIARRLITSNAPPPDVHEVIDRLTWSIELELGALAEPSREPALAQLSNYIAARIAAAPRKEPHRELSVLRDARLQGHQRAR